MKEESKKSIQMDILDDIMDNITNLYKYCISLEERIGNLECECDKMKTDIGMNAHFIRSKFDDIDDIESDITHIFHLMYGCGDFCGNCEHCVSCPDGLYRCDLTSLELDPDSSSCIRFDSSRPPKSDAEICKACSDKDTPRCYKCSHFPF